MTLLAPDDAITRARGVGAKRAELLAQLGITSVRDALWHLPFRYEDRRRVTRAADIALVPEGTPIVVAGEIKNSSVVRARGRALYIASFDVDDGSASVRAALFGGARSFWNVRDGARTAIYGVPELKQISRGRWAYEFKSPERIEITGTEPPSEWACLAPIYRTCAGVPRTWLAKLIHALASSDADLSRMSDPDASEAAVRRGLMSAADALRAVHAPASDEDAALALRSLAYAELFGDQIERISARRAREASDAPSLADGLPAAASLASSLPFDLTPSQKLAIEEISRDVSSSRPMMRLLHGDVGTGKTLVAIAAAAVCAEAGYQAAILVPTAIISSQFASACRKFLGGRARFAELRGGAPKRERGEIIAALARGEISIIIGTHAILEDDVRYARLGLVIVDEQHRFGVRQREMIASRETEASGLAPHVLMMSATPIPRTLAMTMYGDISLTALRERPASRRPVSTRPVSANHISDIYDFLLSAAARGERAYWICPLIDGSDGSVSARADDMHQRAPALRTRELYGSMSGDEKSGAVAALADGEADVLVATTVVEVGVDVPDATVIVIEGASRFGLSTLHQLRGRVGRGGRGGICILLDTARDIASSDRIKIMTETDDGFIIAEEDLRLRGGGDAAGTAQHGFERFRAADPYRDIDLIEMAREDAGART